MWWTESASTTTWHRAQCGSTTIGVGGRCIAVQRINPEDIETIEVLKGPAAAAQYGTAAANGVIQITTKRGRSGKPRWNTFVEGGSIKDVTDYPANYLRTTATSTATSAPFTGTRCTLDSQTRSLCTQAPDSQFVFNPLVTHSPHRGKRGASARASTEGATRVTYYVAGNFDKQQGCSPRASISGGRPSQRLHAATRQLESADRNELPERPPASSPERQQHPGNRVSRIARQRARQPGHLRLPEWRDSRSDLQHHDTSGREPV